MEPSPTRDPDEPRYPHRDRDAGWVAAVRAGDDRAFGWIYDAWFDRVFDLSMRIVRNRDVALEVTQETFLSAWRNLDSLSDPRSFGGWLLRIARNGSLNRQEKERRSQAVDDQELAVMEAVGASSAGSPAGFALEDRLAASHDPQQVVEDNEMQRLVWQAAAALGPRDTQVLDLQLRHGLTPAELGEVLGLNRNAANQLVHRVRQRFEVALKARLLWRGSRPACPDLDALLQSAGVESFSAEAVKIADKHAPGCDACRERRESRLQPAAMFAAVPLIALPVLFKQQTAYALEGAGVPMSGSEFGRSAVAGQATTAGDGSVEPSPGSHAGAFGDGSVIPAPERGDAGDGSVRHLGRRLLMAAAAVIVVFGFIAAVASRVHDPTANEVVAFSNGTPVPSDRSGATSTVTGTDPGAAATAVDAPTSSDPAAPSTTGPGPSTTLPPANQSITTAPPIGSDPGSDPGGGAIGGPTPGNQPRTPMPTGEFRLTIVTAPPRYLMPNAPQLVWTVNGGFTQHITGPNVDETTATGSTPVCPGKINPGTVGPPSCSASPGTYSYQLQVFGSDGTLLVQRTVTLTIRT